MYASRTAARATDDEGCEYWGGLLHLSIPRTGAVGLKELDEMGLILFADALQFEYLPEVGV